jgi:hypothetical protein
MRPALAAGATRERFCWSSRTAEAIGEKRNQATRFVAIVVRIGKDTRT